MSLPNRRKCRKGVGFKNSFGNGRKFGRQRRWASLAHVKFKIYVVHTCENVTW